MKQHHIFCVFDFVCNIRFCVACLFVVFCCCCVCFACGRFEKAIMQSRRDSMWFCQPIRQWLGLFSHRINFNLEFRISETTEAVVISNNCGCLTQPASPLSHSHSSINHNSNKKKILVVALRPVRLDYEISDRRLSIITDPGFLFPIRYLIRLVSSEAECN